MTKNCVDIIQSSALVIVIIDVEYKPSNKNPL